MTAISEFVLGCSKSEINKSVVIAPCWKPQSVGITKCELISSNSCEVWNCIIDNMRFTYVVSGIGAGSCLDIMMALGETRCEKVLFIGSAGALRKGIHIGDIALPKGIVSAEGASRYIGNKLSEDIFGTTYYASKKLQDRLYSFIKNISTKEFSVHDGLGISVESIYLQYKHIEEILSFDCDFIDMESSAFLAATNTLNIDSAILFCISDNVSQGEALYLVSEDKTEFRKRIRKEIMPEVFKEFING